MSRASGGMSGAEVGVTCDKQEGTMAGSAETTGVARAPAAVITEYRPRARLHTGLEARSVVDYSPSEIVSRNSAAWSGLLVETVQLMRHKPYGYGFRAPFHQLIASELRGRHDGEPLAEAHQPSEWREAPHRQA